MKRKIIFVVDGEVGMNLYFEDEGDGTAKFQRNAAHYACPSGLLNQRAARALHAAGAPGGQPCSCRVCTAPDASPAMPAERGQQTVNGRWA